MKDWALPVALGLGASSLAMAALFASRRDTSECPGRWNQEGDDDYIRTLVAPAEKVMRLPGLSDFLVAVAWIESRGNPEASQPGANGARGLFGMRPESARVYELGLAADDLLDPETSVALACWYLERCHRYLEDGQEMTWAAVRRCWSYPALVDNVDHHDTEVNLSKGLACAGVPRDFMERELSRWYRWPGVEAVFDAVGRPLAGEES